MSCRARPVAILVALGLASCTGDGQELTAHGYTLAVIPYDGFFNDIPIRFELDPAGHVHGHTRDDFLHCRADLSDVGEAQLTGSLDAAGVLEQRSSAGGVIDLDAWHVTVTTTDGRSNAFDFGRTFDLGSMQQPLDVMQSILDAIHAAGACGPDRYSIPG